MFLSVWGRGGPCAPPSLPPPAPTTTAPTFGPTAGFTSPQLVPMLWEEPCIAPFSSSLHFFSSFLSCLWIRVHLPTSFLVTQRSQLARRAETDLLSLSLSSARVFQSLKPQRAACRVSGSGIQLHASTQWQPFHEIVLWLVSEHTYAQQI